MYIDILRAINTAVNNSASSPSKVKWSFEQLTSPNYNVLFKTTKLVYISQRYHQFPGLRLMSTEQGRRL